ncbi:glucan endo-1,3-beta-glucosidase [Musa troglodytarum]|uniref:Glucan endo-1,3-beta-glucosidase n=1 Tax=Musa troglodytarum TaxID=320322 RepID=A0A9E7GG57_9LILI|nr:glucan endo-1,3-beta-glucosidase [Musa troglodytarum]
MVFNIGFFLLGTLMWAFLLLNWVHFPGHGSCIFSGGSGSSTSTTGGTTIGSAFGPVGALSEASNLQVVSFAFIIASIGIS